MGWIAELHAETEVPTGRDCPAWRSQDEVENEGHGIVQIGLERTQCYGDCPVYSAVFDSSGQVGYQGDCFVKRKGQHWGTACPYEFRRLAQFIQASAFWSFESCYDFKDCLVTDCPTTYIMVATQDRRKIVSNYGDAGPPVLWAIAELIDVLLRRVKWQKPKSQ